jgi:hypothetical protein
MLTSNLQSTSLPALSTPFSAPSPSVSSGGSDNLQVVTTYDQQGFTTVYTVQPGVTPPALLPSDSPAQATPTSEASAPAAENNAIESKVVPVPTASSGYRFLVDPASVLLAAFIGAIAIIL